MIKEVLPPSLRQDENITKLVEVFDNSFTDINEKVQNVLIYSRIDELPEELLDLLAWQFHIEGWELANSLEEKRNLIRSAIQLHKYKGTKYALKKVLEALNLQGDIQEWFEYNGEPYKFKVYVNSIKSEDLYQKIVNLINEYKNERSWLESIGLHSESKSKVNVGFALKEGKKYDIPVYFDIPNLRNNIYQATAYRVARTTAVGVSKISINTQPNNIYQATAYRVARTISMEVSNG